MINFFLVGVGGFVGAISRFGISQLLNEHQSKFPLATLVVNVSGCFSVGFIFENLREHPQYSTLSLLFVVGFMGAFTTFSAFSLETVQLLKDSELKFAFYNVITNLLLCFGAIVLGGWLGHRFK